ncbi:hypothetical protein [Leptolyngbya sp. 7M]|uniref:hypothetical protein n=1 Tax=Leptolyngbya sp. 7M TaxID=2812896 RepID=UPI001B8BA003|nr:hypothetical protein [Leptolyngbya sp. 7M]QYO65711.1 hypothetical protein JVX88_02665 [Leptolyngbya sp. 7M]
MLSLVHDNLDRLTGMTNGTANESYAFDAVGNRTATHRSAGYTHQPFNKLTSTATATFSYDANGSMIGKTAGTVSWSFVWDDENRLVSDPTELIRSIIRSTHSDAGSNERRAGRSKNILTTGLM